MRAEQTTWADAETAADYDVNSDWHVGNPYPFLRRLRHHHPVFWSEHLGAYAITRYQDVRSTLDDHKSLASTGILTASTELRDDVQELLGENEAFLSRFPSNTDQPTHTRLRRAVSRAFTPRAVTSLGDRFRTEVDDLVDHVAGRGEAEFVADVAQVPTARLMAHFIGVPPEDEERIRAWVADWFTLFLAPHDPARQLDLARGFLEYRDYVTHLVRDRRAHPRDDFTSVTAELIGTGEGDLEERDVVEMISALLLGGNDTVANVLGSAVYRLLESGTWDELGTDPGLVPAAVEETLRYDGAATGIFRKTVRDVELHGVTMPAGNHVFISQDSANHDETVFPEPETFGLRRANAGANMALGHGIHHCIGAALTRLEVTIALEVLTKRLPGLRLAPDQTVRHRRSVTGRGLAALRVEWDPQ